MPHEMTELSDRWILPLRGSRVTQIEWGDRVRFQLDPPGEIVVGSGAYFTNGPKAAPGADAKTISQLGQDEVRRSLGAGILSAVGFKNGALRIVFDNGWHLNVTSAAPFVPASIASGGAVTWSRPSTDAERPSGD
jgi:Family of unknown function (DUF6188)